MVSGAVGQRQLALSLPETFLVEIPLTRVQVSHFSEKSFLLRTSQEWF
jgi:hypothetical protein